MNIVFAVALMNFFYFSSEFLNGCFFFVALLLYLYGVSSNRGIFKTGSTTTLAKKCFEDMQTYMFRM